MEIQGKPLAINAASKQSHWEASREIKLWRELVGWYAKAHKLGPAPVPCKITVTPTVVKQGRSKLPDAVACLFAEKGGVDGLRDAGVLIDDSPEYVHSVTFMAPRWGTQDSLSFEIEPALAPLDQAMPESKRLEVVDIWTEHQSRPLGTMP